MEKVTLRASFYIDIEVEGRDRRQVNHQKLLRRIKNILVNVSDRIKVVSFTNFEPVLEEWTSGGQTYYPKPIQKCEVEEFKVNLEKGDHRADYD